MKRGIKIDFKLKPSMESCFTMSREMQVEKRIALHSFQRFFDQGLHISLQRSFICYAAGFGVSTLIYKEELTNDILTFYISVLILS